MPNYVTNRLEINADRETVQNVMDFLKGKTDEDSTPCYIDFNNIIPMPKDLLIEASTSGEFGMQYIIAQQRKPFNSQDDLKVIQWMEIQEEKVREEACGQVIGHCPIPVTSSSDTHHQSPGRL